MLQQADIIQSLSELKPFLQKEFAVKKIGLFGSFALNEETKDSDIDLLVEFDQPIGWKFLTLEIFLQKRLGRKIDLTTESALHAALKENILDQVVYID